MAEKFSVILFGMILISLAISGFGAFYYAGAVKYGITSPVDFESYSKSSQVYSNITQSLTTLTGGSIDFGSGVGLYLTSAATVIFNFGQFLNLGISMITDLTSISGIAIPSWLTTSAIMFLTITFVLVIAGIFLGRDL